VNKKGCISRLSCCWNPTW